MIPVYAEMATVNPVIVTRGAASDMATVAAGFVGSFTLGAGQFCTSRVCSSPRVDVVLPTLSVTPSSPRSHVR